jgi:hypothetical protein
LTLPELELRPLGRPACCQSLYPLSHPGSVYSAKFRLRRIHFLTTLMHKMRSAWNPAWRRMETQQKSRYLFTNNGASQLKCVPVAWLRSRDSGSWEAQVSSHYDIPGFLQYHSDSSASAFTDSRKVTTQHSPSHRRSDRLLTIYRLETLVIPA